MPVFLLLLLGMLVVLVVLKELVVFVEDVFETVKSQNVFWGKIIEYKRKFLTHKKILKSLRESQKIHLYFRVLHSVIPLCIQKYCHTLRTGGSD